MNRDSATIPDGPSESEQKTAPDSLASDAVDSPRWLASSVGSRESSSFPDRGRAQTKTALALRDGWAATLQGSSAIHEGGGIFYYIVPGDDRAFCGRFYADSRRTAYDALRFVIDWATAFRVPFGAETTAQVPRSGVQKSGKQTNKTETKNAIARKS